MRVSKVSFFTMISDYSLWCQGFNNGFKNVIIVSELSYGFKVFMFQIFHKGFKISAMVSFF